MTRNWIREHIADPYVKRAQADGYPSRAAYKLLEIQEKDRILRPGMTVVDLGAAPGGWSKVAANVVGRTGRVIALDLLPMQPLQGVTFIQGDFNDQAVLDALMAEVGEQMVDLVISDMAPNLSGQTSVDQPRSVQLIELAWDCARRILKPNGDFLTKVFQGAGVEELQKGLRSDFTQLKIRKPEASRSRSREVYLLAKGFRRSGS